MADRILNVSELVNRVLDGERAVFMVRHAERPKMDPDDPTFGDALKLTDEGCRTSLELGRILSPIAPLGVQFHASPLTRTRMTAALIAEGMGLGGAEVPTDELLGNGSFFYDDPAQVLDVFRPENFFNACFEYFRTGEQRGFKNLYQATEACERWLLERFERRLYVVATHDCYIAAFLAAKKAIAEFSRENWPRFLDGGAILLKADGSREYALVRSGLSEGICGVGGKVV